MSLDAVAIFGLVGYMHKRDKQKKRQEETAQTNVDQEDETQIEP